METISDTTSPMETATAWSKNSAPAIPFIKIRGINTAQVVSTEVIKGRMTSFVPLVQAVERRFEKCEGSRLLGEFEGLTWFESSTWFEEVEDLRFDTWDLFVI